MCQQFPRNWFVCLCLGLWQGLCPFSELVCDVLSRRLFHASPKVHCRRVSQSQSWQALLGWLDAFPIFLRLVVTASWCSHNFCFNFPMLVSRFPLFSSNFWPFCRLAAAASQFPHMGFLNFPLGFVQFSISSTIFPRNFDIRISLNLHRPQVEIFEKTKNSPGVWSWPCGARPRLGAKAPAPPRAWGGAPFPGRYISWYLGRLIMGICKPKDICLPTNIVSWFTHQQETWLGLP